MHVGIEVGGSTGELCNQGCGKRNNDINQLALFNKRAKLACGESASGKNPHDIMSCHFQSRPLSRTTL
jgi:hypothetical protein